MFYNFHPVNILLVAISRALVTGGAGFIGGHIVDRLINEGHEVIIVDDMSMGNKSNINEKAIFPKFSKS